MYEYSPIHKIYIRNFRNLGDVELDFSQSPIITLVGENEAGKTSVIKAFGTCALHANPRDQKDFIRDNTKMFGVSIELDNGKRITRIKELGGINSYQITDEQGNMIWNTAKLSEGLPAEVQKLMGLIAEPETGEFLHIRTYEDKLLFVVTPNSTNYKVMYNALKVEQLTKAIKNGSGTVNSLKSAINTNEASMSTLQSQVRLISVVDTEPLISVRDRLVEQMAVLGKIERATELLNKVNRCEIQLGALALIDKFGLSEINEVIASKISNANRLLSRKEDNSNLLSKISEISDLSEIDTGVIGRLTSIIDKINSLDSKIATAGALVQISNIDEISEVVVRQIDKAISLCDKLDSLNSSVMCINTDECNEVRQEEVERINKLERLSTLYNIVEYNSGQLVQVNEYIEQVQNYLKQCGVAVEACPKCGEAVIFDVDKLEG